MEPIVQLKNVSKAFAEHQVLKHISIDVFPGEFLTLLGPSGCGKTTTLRILAGFETPSAGEVMIAGLDVKQVPPYRRDVNTIFQSYALFPHMNVFDNVAFGLKMKKVPRLEIKQRVQDILKLVQLEEYVKREPDQLSGGQKQRVAIARALVNNPKVLLLDEPLGALDLKLRKQLQGELKQLQKKLGITFIYVTHDQEEALTMSDRVVVMNNGVIEQIGTPFEIYNQPDSKFVASFIGEANIIKGKVIRVQTNYAYIDWNGYQVPCVKKASCKLGDEVQIAIRPERIQIKPAADGRLLTIPGKIMERVYVGSYFRTSVALLNGETLFLHEAADRLQPLNPDKNVFICWEPEKAMVMKG